MLQWTFTGEFVALLKDTTVMMLGTFHCNSSGQLTALDSTFVSVPEAAAYPSLARLFTLMPTWRSSWLSVCSPSCHSPSPPVFPHICFPQGLTRSPSVKLWPLHRLRMSSTASPATSWKSNNWPRRYYGNSRDQLWDYRLIWVSSSVKTLNITYWPNLAPFWFCQHSFCFVLTLVL